MPDKNGRAVLPVQCAFGGRNIVFQRCQRVLDDGDPVSTHCQFVIDAAPAGAIRKSAVNKHNIPDSLIRRNGV